MGIKNVNFVYNIVQNFSRRTPHPTSDKNPTLGGSFSCSLLNTPIVHPTLGGSFSCSLLNTAIVHPTLRIKNVNFVYNIVQNFSRRTPHPTSDKNPTLGGSFSCSLLNTPIVHPTLGGSFSCSLLNTPILHPTLGSTPLWEVLLYLSTYLVLKY